MWSLLRHYFPVIAIILTALCLIANIFHPGWYASHDGIFHIYRTEEMLSMLKLGQFPVRWAGNFDQGFGIPLFTFMYPLPYYLSAVLSSFFGPIWALKLVTVAAYAFGGVGMYYLLLPYKKWIALFGSLLFLLTPYQFLNIFVRGTIGETLAISLMPWALLSVARLSANKNTKLNFFHPLPLALILLSHNFLGILFSVFLLTYALITRQQLKKTLLSFCLSLGLAAFFVIPMVSQKNLLYSFAHHDLTFRYDQHFVTLKQLLYGKWDYWYSVSGENDGMSFQLGVAQIISSVMGIITTLIFSRHQKNLFLALAYLGTIFLMHSKSYFIWEFFPLLQAIQFPWRFLFMPLILTPLLAALALSQVRQGFYRHLIMIGLVLLALINVRNYKSPIKFFDNTEYTDLYLLYFHKTSTTFRTEILPKWSVPNERYKNDELLVNSGNMTIDSLTFDPLSITTTINNKPDSSEGRVTILRNYYPGWVVTMDDTISLPVKPTEDGMITLEPQLGIHTYEIKIQSTPIEQVSNTISLISLCTLGWLWQKNSKKSLFKVKSS